MKEYVQHANLDVQELKETVDVLTRDITTIKETLEKANEVLGLIQRTMAETRVPEQEASDHGDASRSNPHGKRDGGKNRRLELPVFAGEDPSGWLFRVERYFLVNTIVDQEKMEATMVCLEGRALN